jgi:spore germination protein YaaH
MLRGRRRAWLGLGLWALLGAGDLPRLGGWITYWGYQAALASARAANGTLADLYFFALDLDPDGHPQVVEGRQDYAQAIAEFRRANARTWLTVVNDRRDSKGRFVAKDGALVHAVLSDPAARAAHVRRLVELCRDLGADGLEVDYENLDPQDKDAFSGFLGELAGALHGRGLLLSVAVLPKTREVRSRGPGGADWRAIGQVADQMQIMLYNEHDGHTGAGPTATPAFMAQVLGFAETQCDQGKIVPALKVTGFEWGGKVLPAGIRDLGTRIVPPKGEPRRDPDSRSPWFQYQAEGETRTVYYEDAVSLAWQLGFLGGKGYSRVTLWRLGAEDPEFWRLAGGAPGTASGPSR